MEATPDDPVAKAFEEFLTTANATIHPNAFLHWIRKNQPELLSRISKDEVLTFASRYFSAPLKSATNEDPVKLYHYSRHDTGEGQ